MTRQLAWFLLGTAIMADAQSAPESLLTYRITGSSNSSLPADNATYAMQHAEVQRLLLAVAASPRDRVHVENALQGSGISLDNMLRNGSLRLESERYWLNFSLLLAADQETIVRAANVYSRRLADAVLARRSRIEALLRSYDLVGVDSRAAAFLVRGCLSLDWDGLNFATDRGYRATAPKRPGGHFFIMAEERGGPSLKQIYWSSSHSMYGNYGFVSFGDPPSSGGDIWTIRRNGSPELRTSSPRDFAEKVGSIVLALRDGPLEATQLAVRDVDSVLPGLVSIGYVRKEGE